MTEPNNADCETTKDLKSWPNCVADSSLGSYPRYGALWHLDFINLSMSRLTESSNYPKGWEEAIEAVCRKGQGRTRVALIDTPVTFQHPNLAGVFTDLSMAVDFTLFPPLDPLEPKPEDPEKRANAIQRRVNYLVRCPSPPYPIYAEASVNSGSHGTAMAGLIAARPTAVALYRPERIEHNDSGKPERSADFLPLPYAGVDPTCEILPISISARPGPDELFAALYYASMRAAQMIVLAVDVPNPLKPCADTDKPNGSGRKEESSSESEQSRLEEGWKKAETIIADPTVISFWPIVTRELIELSKTIPIFCAAGNEPDRAAYPARLARLRENGIFSIGAVNARGDKTSYSPGGCEAVTLFGPSGDDERNDRNTTRLDVYRRDFGEDAEEPYFTGQGFDKMPVQDIITTDLPGPYGYNNSIFDEALLPCTSSEGAMEPCSVPTRKTKASYELKNLTEDVEKEKPALPVYLDFASNFCRFSGTSAATGIVAGLFSLAISAGELRGFDPVAFKKKLADSSGENPQIATWDLILEINDADCLNPNKGQQ